MPRTASPSRGQRATAPARRCAVVGQDRAQAAFGGDVNPARLQGAPAFTLANISQGDCGSRQRADTECLPADNQVLVFIIPAGAHHFQRRTQPRFLVDNLPAVLVHFRCYPENAVCAALNMRLKRVFLWLAGLSALNGL